MKNNNRNKGKNIKNNTRTKQTMNRRKKKRVWPKVFLIILLILLIAGGVFAYKVYKNGGGLTGILATAVGHDENKKKSLEEFKCLVLGISTDEQGALLTDTIMVASYNPNTQKATLLSIPRDTFTGTNPAKATPYQKINSVYSRKQDPQDILDAVNKVVTGLNLEYYVIVKTEGFIKLVDAIGGVTFNVPIDMDYDDTHQDLHIHLKAGEQLLDGDKAEQLVRFRHNNDGTSYPEEYGDNDVGRMRTQREFMMAVIKQTAKVENIFKLGEILDVAEENVITNINFDVAKDYIPYAVEFNTDNLLTAVLPGENTNKNDAGTWVFVADEDETAKLIQELFYDRDKPEEETTEENTTNNTNTAGTSSVSTKSKSEIKIEIINGTGVSKNLQLAVDDLEDAGYKVTRTGNTNTTSKTIIMNKKNVSGAVLEGIENTIGIGTIEDTESSSSKVDVTIILGRDYNNK